MINEWQRAFERRRLKIKTGILWLVYLSYVLILTLKPYQFSVNYLDHFLKFQHGFFYGLFSSIKPMDIFLNILLFLPFGFLTARLLKCLNHPPEQIMKMTILASIITSLFAELSQLFLIRTASVVDVATNTLGGFLGALLALRLQAMTQKTIEPFIMNRQTVLVKLVRRFYLLMLILVFSLPIWLNGFDNWDDQFYLLVGNEATGDRPWAGTVYELAIYDRVLTSEEILQCHYQRPPISVKANLLVSYRFNTSSGSFVPDQAGIFSDFHLMIQDSQKVQWEQNPPGLTISEGGLLKSKIPASALSQRLKQTHQFSLVVRFKPANLTQTGPARIVSLSASPDQRNFTLGQATDKLNFRIRTPLTGPNGSIVDLFTELPVLTTKIQHVVGTFNRGAAQIYLNGQLLAASVHGISNYIPALTGFGNGTVGKICFCFLLLFPLGWLSQDSVYFNRSRMLRGIFLTISPLLIVQGVSVLHFQQPVDLPILISASVTAFVAMALNLFPFNREVE